MRTHRGMALRGLIIAGGVVVVLVAAGVVAVSASAAPSRARSSGPADLATAEPTSFVIETTATGELEAKNQIEIRCQLEGQSTIVEVAPEGSVVKAGDTLVVLDSEDIKDQIAEEELRVESARNDYESAKSSYEIQVAQNAAEELNAERDVELAELAKEQWVNGDHVKRIKQLDQAIESAQRNYERLKKKFENSQKLFKEEFISSDEYELDEIAMLEAESKLEIAQLDKETYLTYEVPREQTSTEATLDNAKTKLDRVKKENEINLTNKASNKSSRERQLELHENKLEELNEQLAAATITAPAGGLVVYATSMERSRFGFGNDGPLQVGRSVHHNELLIVLPDTSEMVASVRVHESLAGRIRPGQRAEIRIDAAGGKSFPGAVDSIGVLAESGGWRDPNRREYRVKISLDADNTANGLKPSMRCEATIALGSVDDALAVPVQSVFSDGPVHYVLVERGSKFARRPVRVGRRSSVFAEITAGLEPGERVLTRDPVPGEVLNDSWDKGELELVGLSLDEEGNPVAPRTAPPPGMMRPDGAPGPGAERPEASQRPGGVQRPDGAHKPAEAQDSETAQHPDGSQKPEKAEGSEAAQQGGGEHTHRPPADG